LIRIGPMAVAGKIELSTPVESLKGVGPARALHLGRLGIRTAGDLLEYFPRNWEFVAPRTDIMRLEAGRDATVVGIIESTAVEGHPRHRRFEAVVVDDTASLTMVWFGQAFLAGRLKVGQVIKASGKVTRYKKRLQMANPKFEVVAEGRDEPGGLSPGGPVYPATVELTSGCIKGIIGQSLEKLLEQVEEFYDDGFRERAGVIRRRDAFRLIHRPRNAADVEAARRRLKYDELFLMQLALAIRRRWILDSAAAPPAVPTAEIDRRIRRRFPFLLTEDQNAVIGEITSDMSRNRPMNRLLQGDVGSGKTVVALYAALLAVARRLQVVMMAPTEILAWQHFRSCERYLKKSRVNRLLVTGGLTGAERRQALAAIAAGRVDIVVGTVALLHRDVRFRRLGLAVIDEQHKFGVHQRAGLRRDDGCHCLVMTATPIPRTLAMTVFGDLDVSTIRSRPPGGCSVVTRVVGPEMRHRAYDFIRQRLSAGGQAYFVYPWIAGTDEAGALKAAADQYRRLSADTFAGFRVGLLHGRMPSRQKERVMADFCRRRIDVLVSTVVIEVGLDVPNATIMVIESAERFGLAQLHQLRGRIGRAGTSGEPKRAYCLLFTEGGGEAAEKRLRIMTRTNDGFAIAEEDLRLRGPGELFSTRQHGLPDLKIADIIADGDLLRMTRRHAFELVEQDPALADPAHAALRKALFERFGDSFELSRVA